MKIAVKPGVRFKYINDYFVTMARIVYMVYKQYDITPTITSANDGKHGGNSYHYEDLAWDWRIWGLNDPKAVADEIRIEAKRFDPHYDVVLEKDHIHTEYDAKKPL